MNTWDVPGGTMTVTEVETTRPNIWCQEVNSITPANVNNIVSGCVFVTTLNLTVFPLGQLTRVDPLTSGLKYTSQLVMVLE